MRISGLVPLVVAAALAGCSQPAELSVTDAWVRLAAIPGAPAVAYFTLHGGATDDRLLDVTSPNVIRVELHETMKTGTMMSMKPIAGGAAVPAGSVVEFKQGGRHAMLFNINPGITPARTLPMIFTFASGNRLRADAKVFAAGTSPDK